MRNCAPWNGALTVTGGSIGLSGCSNGYGRGTSNGIHLGPMTGEAPTLRCDTLLHSRTLSELYQCLILFRQKAVGGWVSKSLEKVVSNNARICDQIDGGSATLSCSCPTAFITSSELVSDCMYDAYPERLSCPVTQNELGRVPPPFENEPCLHA